MKSEHDCPTLYYVGPAWGEGPVRTQQPGGPIICAEYTEGVSAPRYLYFSDIIEVEAYRAQRAKTAKARGSDYHFKWSDPVPWSPDSQRAVWPTSLYNCFEQLTEKDSSWFRAWVQQDKRYLKGGSRHKGKEAA